MTLLTPTRVIALPRRALDSQSAPFETHTPASCPSARRRSGPRKI